MTVVNQTGLPTLMDIQKELDPKGQIANIIPTLTRTSPLLQRMGWKEANGADGELLTLEASLPGAAWRQYNKGTTPTKGVSSQFTETCGMLSSWSVVDSALAKRNGNVGAYRAKQDMKHVKSFHRTLEKAFWYQSTKTNPDTVMGLSPRLDALTGIPYSSQVIPFDPSPSGTEQASVWLVGFGEDKVYGIYPPGSEAGLKMTDLGEVAVEDADGGEFLGYKTNFSWDCGLAVADAEYVVRICNIDTASGALVATGHILIDKMIAAAEQLKSLDDCLPVFFMNRTIRTYLRQQAVDSTRNSTLTFDEVGGKPVLSFQGIPIERTDELLNTEAILT